jgi:hypothetical protein
MLSHFGVFVVLVLVTTDDKCDYIIDGNTVERNAGTLSYCTTLLTRKRAHSLAYALPRT